jgi:CRISPR-associated protein Csb2
MITLSPPTNSSRRTSPTPNLTKQFVAGKREYYTVARYALSSTVLPLITDAMPFAEMTRFALSDIRGQQTNNSYSQSLVGKTTDGEALKGHEHAHFFATDEDRDGRLDHLTVHAPCGLNTDDVNALGQLRYVRRYKNLPDVRMVLLGLGKQEDFSNVPVFRTSKHWRSVTPFSLPRFANRGGGKPPRPRDLPEAQLGRELRSRGLPEPVTIVRLDGYGGHSVRSQESGQDACVRKFRWLEYHTRRLRKDSQGFGLAGFEIEFAEPVSGPISVGFGCHFGLGLFLPCDMKSAITHQMHTSPETVRQFGVS